MRRSAQRSARPRERLSAARRIAASGVPFATLALRVSDVQLQRRRRVLLRRRRRRRRRRGVGFGVGVGFGGGLKCITVTMCGGGVASFFEVRDDMLAPRAQDEVQDERNKVMNVSESATTA